MVDSIFYDDAQMRYLLTICPVRYTNVYHNQWGNMYFGGSHRLLSTAEALGRNKPIYRIVVRAKHLTPLP